MLIILSRWLLQILQYRQLMLHRADPMGPVCGVPLPRNRTALNRRRL